MNTFTCFICGNIKPKQKDGGTGYAINSKNKKICYECCAIEDKRYMKKDGKIVLYLSGNEITNWSGTLRFDIIESKESMHNWGLTRTDVWFFFEFQIWHGYSIGDNTQICHCKRTKKMVV